MRKQKNGRKRGAKGAGIGAHQEVSPMARATRTKSKREQIDRRDRRERARGWE